MWCLINVQSIVSVSCIGYTIHILMCSCFLCDKQSTWNCSLSRNKNIHLELMTLKGGCYSSQILFINLYVCTSWLCAVCCCFRVCSWWCLLYKIKTQDCLFYLCPRENKHRWLPNRYSLWPWLRHPFFKVKMAAPSLTQMSPDQTAALVFFFWQITYLMEISSGWKQL